MPASRVDFVALAGSFGVAGTSVGRADELADAVEEALAAEEPRLVQSRSPDSCRAER